MDRNYPGNCTSCCAQGCDTALGGYDTIVATFSNMPSSFDCIGSGTIPPFSSKDFFGTNGAYTLQKIDSFTLVVGHLETNNFYADSLCMVFVSSTDYDGQIQVQCDTNPSSPTFGQFKITMSTFDSDLFLGYTPSIGVPAINAAIFPVQGACTLSR